MLKTKILTILLLCSISVFSQGSIDDIGVVWSKTYGSGAINNIKSNANDGNYTAAGMPYNNSTPAGVQRLEGLIVEFDESGNELRRFTARIPQSYIDDPNHSDLSTAYAQFTAAFKTDDGGYVAFGFMKNSRAPGIEKGPDWSGVGVNNPTLKVGIWIVKFDSNLNITLDTLVHGNHLKNAWQLSNGNIAVAGFDDNSYVANNCNGCITLLRIYDQNGNLVSNKRANYLDLFAFYKHPITDNFIAYTGGGVLKIDSDLNVTSVLNLNTTLGIYGQMASISLSQDGGCFVGNITLNSHSNPVINYTNGMGFFKLDGSKSRKAKRS